LKSLHSKHGETLTIDDLIIYAKCKEESNMDSSNVATNSSSDYYSALSSSHSENEQYYKPRDNYFSTQAVLNYQYPPSNQMEMQQIDIKHSNQIHRILIVEIMVLVEFLNKIVDIIKTIDTVITITMLTVKHSHHRTVVKMEIQGNQTIVNQSQTTLSKRK